MKRCPKCHRFGLEYDPILQTERCLWINCLWVNWDHDEIDEGNNSGSSYDNTEFVESLTIKKDIVL